MRRISFIVLLLALLTLVGCGSEEKAEINSFEDMKDKSLTIGIPDDVDCRTYITELCPGVKIEAQNDILYGVRSVSEGKLDGFVVGKEYIEKAIKESGVKNVKILDEPIHVYNCALGLSELCDIPDYESSVNNTMNELISSGTIAEMRDRWFNQGCDEMPEIVLDENPEYTLNAVTFGQIKPYSYIVNGELAGFDVELLYRVCAANHWGINLSHADYPGMLMGLSTGKFDMVSANLYITDNREENINFSVSYLSEEISLAVQGESGEVSLEYNTLEELNNAKTFAVVTGTICDTVVKEKYPDAEIKYFSSLTDCALAVSGGKADATLFDSPSLKYLSASHPELGILDEYIINEKYSFIMPKSERGEKLNREFNEWLSALKASGEHQKLIDYWCSTEEPLAPIDYESLPSVNGTVSVANTPVSRPDVYYFNNGLTGFPLELIYNFCRDSGYGMNISIINYESMVATVVSEKADFVIGYISYTDERAESVLYTDCIFEGGMGVLVRTAGNSDDNSFIDTVISGLKKTFVTEARWKLIVSGLGVTFLITFGSFILANILGVAFCLSTMSKKKFFRILSAVYDRIMQGTPIVVVLMLLYYVVFGKSHVSGIFVAIIGFGLASGASLSQQFYGAVNGVNIGQTEAALTLGFTKFEAFRGIVLPQAARIALPGYFSELISLMKGTAIVGYIAVTDLTKASDLIRSSTYDAFFPLLSVALIYFLIAFCLLSLLKHFKKKLAPKRVGNNEAV